MSTPVLPNTSNFLGVALVINRSRDGPRFVFNYPAHVPPLESASSKVAGEDIDDDDDDVLLDRMTASAADGPGLSSPSGAGLAHWNREDHLATDSGSQIVPWEHIGGFPTQDLQKILTPARVYHKKLFHISVDQLHFVSYPIFVPESGIWKKKQKQPKTRPAASEAGTARNGKTPSVTASDVPQIETRDMAEEALGPEEVAEEKKSGMTMFNLVFVLNPKRHEAKELIEMLYVHIIRKINKVYKYAQMQSEFVWKESKAILALKEKGREDKTRFTDLWAEILDTSSLAGSIRDIYRAVSQNRVATLQLETAEGLIPHSVQIPVPFYISDLPPEHNGAHSSSRSQGGGLWLTTANELTDTDALTEDPFEYLDKNFALLFLSDEQKIISELQGDPDDATAPLVELVRRAKPTLSFYQISQANILSPGQVRKYARHIISWRRAMAIPPLHARDVYIMSPNAPTADLPRDTQLWSRSFPLLPPLPNFLAELSAAPRPYKSFAPSKNHRPTYIAMLAWLMQRGWVTQLCTFAYVVVWPEIQYEVEHQLEALELKKLSEPEPATPSGAPDATSASADDNNVPKEGEEEEDAPESDSTSPSSQRTESNEPSSPDKKSPTTAYGPKTANESKAEEARLSRLADRESRAHTERAALHARKPVPQQTSNPSTNRAAHLAGLTPYVILDAKRPTGKESLYLKAIKDRFADPRVREYWPVFWKYFNGRSALERIVLLETGNGLPGLSAGGGNGGEGRAPNKGLKRKEVWHLLSGMGEYLLTVRHW